MKPTKKQMNQLYGMLGNLQRAYNYIQKPEVVGIAHKVKPGNENGADYAIINPACIETCSNVVMFVRPMNKDIGSDIAGLSMALNQLKNFIEECEK
jgi:hypothetical protein